MVTGKDEIKHRELSLFHRYLTVWVLLCMAIGVAIGSGFPQMADALNAMQVAQVNLPVAVLLWFMMYPIMVQIDFGKVAEAVRAPKPVVLTLVVNWLIKPFTMAFFAWLFMRVLFVNIIGSDLASEYSAGMILLGVAPCTAMVLVWSYLAKGNMGHTLVMVAINSLTMVFLYAPLGRLLLGVADLPIPFATMVLSVFIYVAVPLIAGYYSRKVLISTRGPSWFEEVFMKYLDKVAISALLITLVALFVLQGQRIVQNPLDILLISVPLLIQTLFIFAIGYFVAMRIGLTYENAAPAAMIGASNHFEVAIATAATIWGLAHGAALATVVGVLIEVPVMLLLVRICLRTRSSFRSEHEVEVEVKV
jgi:ACR3 family arsenite transporter